MMRSEDLGADAQVAVGDELWLFMAVLYMLQVHVQHAHSYGRESHHVCQDLPFLDYKRGETDHY